MTGPFQGGGDPPKVSAIVVSYNTRDDLGRCLASLRAHVTLPLEVVVVDNASTDRSVEVVRRDFPTARLVALDTNRGFSAANNEGRRASKADYLLALNSDAEVTPGAVETMAGLLDARPTVGIIGPMTRNPDGTIQVSFGPDLTPFAEWRQRRRVRGVRARDLLALREAEAQASVEHEPAWVSGSCFLARRQALEAVAGFDEGFFLYEEDADLCLRLRRAGWTVVYTPAAEVRHAQGRSMDQSPERARLEYHRSHLRYYRKHNGAVWTAVLRIYLAALGLRLRLGGSAGAQALVRLGLTGR